MHKTIPLDTHVKEVKALGNVLMHYNYPQVKADQEDDINNIKIREIVLDGYSIIVHYSKADYPDHYLETLQVLGEYMPFLPFSIVCKVGKKFLGDKYLSFVEIFKDNRKIYCWTLATNKQGQAIEGPYKTDNETSVYEGLEYRIMNLNQVNFY